ncbi:hypothetical protein N0V82_000015 [Gnomoniopsis sp. IMI 355080]|nr:hypothetical protein N0V82_000015 [Gnomoniopsis sp. IMI 355080]
MPFSYGDLTVRGRDGRRVAITDCKLEPLNLLIPGNAPIIVPKRHAWRSPTQQAKSVKSRNKSTMMVAQDEYEADSEDDEEEDDFEDETKPLIKRSKQSRDKIKGKCKKDSIVREKTKEAKHLRRAERHQKNAELEREEAASEHERLQKRIAKQEAYILRLKARYDKADEEGTNGNSSNNAIAKASDSDDGGTTDGSAAVREMLANIKIRAGGKENPRFVAQPGELPWNVSDDSQLIALKNDSSNSYAVIGECMGRGGGEVKRRYKFLKACEFKIPGGDETIEAGTTEAEKTGVETTYIEKLGEETTDVEQTGEEITDAEKMDEKNKNGAGNTADTGPAQDQQDVRDDEWTEQTDTQLWKLKDDGKTWAEIHAVMGKSKSGLKDRYKHLKSIDFVVPDKTNDFEKRNKYEQDNAVEGAANKSSSTRSKKASSTHGPSPAPYHFAAHDAGTNAYIAQYSRNLFAEANAGRTSIPEPDEIFDEDDCILLALADSRRRENRWLDIQADYFNVTGRMVPQEVLMWKLGGAEKPGNVDEEDC